MDKVLHIIVEQVFYYQINGNILAVGTIFESTTGVVRIYWNVSGTWTQISNTIYGEGNSDRFGSSISLSGDGKTIEGILMTATVKILDV